MLFNPRINGETVFDVRKLAAGQESRRSFAKEKMSKKSRDRCRRLLQKKGRKRKEKWICGSLERQEGLLRRETNYKFVINISMV